LAGVQEISIERHVPKDIVTWADWIA
jgi:hypothetical protein